MHKCYDLFMTLTPQDLHSIGQIMDEKLKKELKPIKRKLNSIQKDLKWTMLKYDTRLVHLESHIIHPPGRATN